MELTPDDVQDILHVLDSSDLDELQLELPELTLTVRRAGGTGWTAEQQVLRAPDVQTDTANPGTASPATTAPTSEPVQQPAEVAAGMVAVHPPLPGSFYRAPQPGADPFVAVGDHVDEATVIGIVETMKMMTPVRAGALGTVVEIPAGNGDFVQAGTVLLLIEPESR